MYNTDTFWHESVTVSISRCSNIPIISLQESLSAISSAIRDFEPYPKLIKAKGILNRRLIY